ncbi:MAG: TonB-dependent receptor [Pseudomonadota bacterium]
MKQKLITAALFSAVISPLPAYAETPVLQEVVVTATRFPSPPQSSAGSVTVITSGDIEKSAASTLPGLLAQHAGIHVSSSDGTADMAIDMRGFGASGNQNTLVLLDGQQLNDIDLTAIRWSAIPLASIERIEIMNGDGAVLYGGGATGGTINIITRHPDKPGAGQQLQRSASIGAGSYATNEWQLALTSTGDRVRLYTTVGGLESANYRANNHIDQNNLEADARTDAGPGVAIVKFGANYQNLRYPGPRRVDPAAGVDQLATDRRGTSTPLDYGQSDGRHISLGTSQPFTWGDLAVEVAYRDKQQQAYFDAFGGSYLDTNLNRRSLTPRVKIPYQLGGLSHELITGLDIINWDYDSTRANSPAAVNTPSAHILARQLDRGLYVQDTSQLSVNNELTLGARIQQVDYQARDAANPAPYASGTQERTVTAYEAGLRHNLKPGWSLFGRLSRSFRIATVDEIYDQYGGPSFDSRITVLEPQTARHGEAGIDYGAENNKVRVSIYHINLNNEIHYNAITFRNMNLAPTRRYGLEMEGTHRYTERLAVTAAYSYTVAKFREGSYNGVDVSGNDIPLVPRQRLALSSSWEITAKNMFSGMMTYVGEQRFDNDQANAYGQKMPAYATVDVKLAHREGRWRLTAAVNNLFNRKYFTYAVASTFSPGVYNAYPMPERNFLLNANYSF